MKEDIRVRGAEPELSAEILGPQVNKLGDKIKSVIDKIPDFRSALSDEYFSPLIPAGPFRDSSIVFMANGFEYSIRYQVTGTEDHAIETFELVKNPRIDRHLKAYRHIKTEDTLTIKLRLKKDIVEDYDNLVDAGNGQDAPGEKDEFRGDIAVTTRNSSNGKIKKETNTRIAIEMAERMLKDFRSATVSPREVGRLNSTLRESAVNLYAYRVLQGKH